MSKHRRHGFTRPSAATAGFTIVELLIVIVVIAILAAITIVAYNGIQARASNVKITSAVNTLEKAVQLWHVDTGNLPYSGGSSTATMPVTPTNGEACPGATTTGGWVASGSGYSCGLEDLLKAYKLIPSTLISSLPPNKNTNNSYKQTLMFYQCSALSNIHGYILMWYLDSPSSTEAANFDTEWQKCANSSTATANSSIYYTNYGMRNGKFMVLD